MEFVEEQNGNLESGPSTSDGNGQQTVGTATDLEHNAVRRVYLVTYSQANLEHFPKRRSFAQAVVGSFSKANGKVLQWVCYRESHENGGHHYHLAFKLDRCQRWLSSKNYMRELHGITVHFSNLHYNYYSAWRYVTKEDEHVLQSEDHPDLWNSKAPKTNTACNERKKVRMEGDIAISTQSTVSGDDLEDDCFEVETTASDVDDNTKRKKRKKRLTSFELLEIIVEKGIKTRTELLAFANM